MTKSIFFLWVALAMAWASEEDEYRRDVRQGPIFFQNGLQPRPKQPSQPQPIIPKFAGFGGPPPQGFRPATPVVDDEEEEEIERNSITPPSQQLLHFRQQPPPSPQPIQFRPTSPIPLPSGPLQPITSAQVLQPQQTIVLRQRPQQQQQQQERERERERERHEFQQDIRRPQHSQKNQISQGFTEEELEDKEEPDRLTQLLPQSKFTCSGKKTGYYADDGLNCEVFHYCQESARHSWICPEGFVFHQVHLICMPPSSENICQQSSQFHFVNDFLYRAINVEEAQTRPNVTLRYADRYYPENYVSDTRGEDEDTGENVRNFQHRPPPQQRRPVQYQQQQPQLRPHPSQAPQQFTRQPFAQQVFHNPEDINIPLQSRRPLALVPSPSPSSPQRHQQNFDLE